MTLYYDDPDDTRPNCFRRARDSQAARYIAEVDDANVPRHVILRYRIQGEIRWQGDAVALDPLTPKDGTHEFLYRNGTAERRFMLVDGAAEGVETIRFSDGGRCAEVQWTSGRRQCVVTTWHADGKPRSEWEYRDGTCTDIVVEYYPSGTVRRRRRVVDWEQRGLTCWYHENGLLKNIVHHMAIRSCSEYFSFREDGTLRAGQAFLLDDRGGFLYRHTYPGGRPRWEVTVRNGRPNGEERAWDENGTLMRHNVWADGWLMEEKGPPRESGRDSDQWIPRAKH